MENLTKDKATALNKTVFNRTIKEQFIKEGSYKLKNLKIQPDTISVYKFFNYISSYEAELKKDLYEFNQKELVDVLYSASSQLNKKEELILAIARIYRDWCSKKNYAAYTYDVAKILTAKEIKESIKEEQEGTFIYSLEDLDMLCSKCSNKQNSAILLLTFLYVTNTLQYEDLSLILEKHWNEEDSYIFINKRKVNIPSNLTHYINEALEEKEYRVHSRGETDCIRKYLDSKYLFKRVTTGRLCKSERVSIVAFESRVEHQLKLLGNYSIRSIIYSGLFMKMQLLEDSRNLTSVTIGKLIDDYNLSLDTTIRILKKRFIYWKINKEPVSKYSDTYIAI